MKIHKFIRHCLTFIYVRLYFVEKPEKFIVPQNETCSVCGIGCGSFLMVTFFTANLKDPRDNPNPVKHSIPKQSPGRHLDAHTINQDL